MSCWFSGSTVLLTGASSGIGLELARQLIGEYGCIVIGTARNAERLSRVAAELGESFIPCPFDVTDRRKWTSLVKKLDAAGIYVDLLINNAGVLPPFDAYPCGGGYADLRRVTEINYLSQAAACEILLPQIMSSPDGGIVNISSAAALASLPGTAAYSGSKAACLAFTEAMAMEYKGQIYVGAVCPGMTDTPLFASCSGAEKFAGFAMDPEKAARKILRGVKRRRRRIVCGTDAHLMSGLHRLLGGWALDIFSAFLRNNGGEMFSRAFVDSYFSDDEDEPEDNEDAADTGRAEPVSAPQEPVKEAGEPAAEEAADNGQAQ